MSQQDFDVHARFKGESYQDILDRDSRPVPECLRLQEAPYLGSESIPAEHYTDPQRFKLEVEKMWIKTNYFFDQSL